MAMSVAAESWACNCSKGADHPDCCINRGKQDELTKAWRAGREGRPCPKPAGTRPIGLEHWETSIKLDGLHDAPFLQPRTHGKNQTPPSVDLSEELKDYEWADLGEELKDYE